jgi:hypothetical protein
MSALFPELACSIQSLGVSSSFSANGVLGVHLRISADVTLRSSTRRGGPPGESSRTSRALRMPRSSRAKSRSLTE